MRYLCLVVTAAALLPAVRSGATTTGPYCGATTLYKANGTAWRCTFDDEFQGSSLDRTKWTPITTASTGLAYSGGCFVDSPNNIYVSDGYLHLVARKESAPISCQALSLRFWTSYTAGQIATAGHFAQTYGLFAVRAKFPAATVAGLQSSLWMWPQNLTTTNLHGEIDIAEEYSNHPYQFVPYLHYAYDPSTVDASTNTNIVTRACLIGDLNAFHVYAAQWSASTISIYEDGRLCLQDNIKPSGKSPFDQPFFLELTQALGSSSNAFAAGSTPLPATTEIDWVRAWK
jgi:beta-glucanase (GH16 family)